MYRCVSGAIYLGSEIVGYVYSPNEPDQPELITRTLAAFVRQGADPNWVLAYRGRWFSISICQTAAEQQHGVARVMLFVHASLDDDTGSEISPPAQFQK